MLIRFGDYILVSMSITAHRAFDANFMLQFNQTLAMPSRTIARRSKFIVQ